MGATSTQSASVLVVDDFPRNQLILEGQLRRFGHKVLFASNGQEALDILRSRPVDLILLDIMMPVMDGFEFLAIAKADPALRHLPVVVVSALDDTDNVARCITLGAEDYLFKPINLVLLEARVEACLARKRWHDQERAARAAAEAANHAKDTFVSMVAHELKNPLSGIAGYTDMLLLETLGELSPLQHQSVSTIRDLTSLMSTIISDLTNLSKIESGRVHIAPAPTALRSVVTSAVDAVHKLLTEKEHQLTIALPAGLPLVLADPMRLTQVLTNLLSNASKYTPPRGTLTLSAESRDATTVEVAVCDDGAGIPLEEQGKIFQPFFRTYAARTSTEAGTGLGLSITRRLVELQGGQILVQQRPGRRQHLRLHPPGRVAHRLT